jgi:putative transposase
MSHSFTNLLFHIIFSTKNREPLMQGELSPRLFAYLGGVITEASGSRS